METVRVIPCLDVKDGRVVKGVSFVDLVDSGDPVELGTLYESEGADEIVFLDINASHEGRRTMVDIVKETASEVFIPLTVGGGVDSLSAAEALLRAGADKVSLNSAALARPSLIDELASVFGSQCVVVAIDSKYDVSGYKVFSHGGRRPTDRDALQWAVEATSRGAGEILATSMDRDGTRLGYDTAYLAQLSSLVTVPIVASGGVGELPHFAEGVRDGGVQAVLAASVFHFGEISIAEVKRSLSRAGISVREYRGNDLAS